MQAGEFWSISFQTVATTNLHRIAEIETWGVLSAAHILRFGCLPPTVSPFLFQAVIGGISSILDIELIHELAPDQSHHFQQWLSLGPDTILTLESHAQLIRLVSATLSMEVRDLSKSHSIFFTGF